MVVVLIPPAVEIGEPPINIKTQDTAFPAVERLSWLYVTNPAVRHVTDWKQASKNVIGFSLLKHSVQTKIKIPETNKIPVVVRTILVNALHWLGFLLKSTMSKITRNEIPPTIINNIV